MPPCREMPFMMAPMPCSRMPKCRLRPYGLVLQVSVVMSSGPNDGSPLITVLLEPARSADPPHSSGSVAPNACSVASDALRVATPLASGSHTGRSSAQPSGSSRRDSLSNSALCSGLAAAHASNFFCHSACFSVPRSAAVRVWLITSSAMKKFTSGSNPSSRLVAATSSSPSAAP